MVFEMSIKNDFKYIRFSASVLCTIENAQKKKLSIKSINIGLKLDF